MSKSFNEQFRRIVRHEPEPEEDPEGSPSPSGGDESPKRTTPSVDAGAATTGERTGLRRPSMNDFIRKAARGE